MYKSVLPIDDNTSLEIDRGGEGNPWVGKWVRKKGSRGCVREKKNEERTGEGNHGIKLPYATALQIC